MTRRRHSCRDTEAHPHGPCDHRDFPVSRKRWSMPSFMQVVQVLPSRSHARCVQRQVRLLRSSVAAHQQGRLYPVVAQSLIPMFSVQEDHRDSPVAVHMVIDVLVVKVEQVPSCAVVEVTAATSSCGMKLAQGAGRALCTGTGPGLTPPLRRGRGGGDAGSFLPGALPPKLSASSLACLERHACHVTSSVPQPPQPPQPPQGAICLKGDHFFVVA